MKIYVISADGYGAGKSTFARLHSDEVWSLAGALREDLAIKYPGYHWFSKDQKYKDKTVIKEYGDGRKTLREVLINHGQEACDTDPLVWVRKLASRLERRIQEVTTGAKIFAIDDVRKTSELDHLRQRFGPRLHHFHVECSTATPEPHFENDKLKRLADYVVRWEK